MKTAQLIVKCLEDEGVDYIFGVPGEESMDLLDALLGSSIYAHSRTLGSAAPCETFHSQAWTTNS